MRRLRVDDLRDAVLGDRRFERGRYCGFAIGSQSIHDVCTIIVQGQRYTLRPGLVLPVAAEPTSDVVIETIRQFNGYLAEVIGLETPAELAGYGIPQRAPLLDSVTGSAGDGAFATVGTFPFAGRRHAAISVGNPSANSNNVSFQILGRRYWGSGGSDYDEYTLESSFTVTPGNVAGKHIGGTDSEEALDELLVQAQQDASAETVRVTIDAFGELGGN